MRDSNIWFQIMTDVECQMILEYLKDNKQKSGNKKTKGEQMSMAKKEPCPFCIMKLSDYSVKRAIITNTVTLKAILNACSKHFLMFNEIRERKEDLEMLEHGR